MQRKSTAPRIGEQSAKLYPSLFSSLNAGLEYTCDAFPALYRRTLHEMRGRFNRAELLLIIDVFNSTALLPGLAGQHIAAQVADGIALDRLDSKWGIDGAALNAKIGALPIFAAACLEIWANGFWYRGDTGKRDLRQNDFDDWMAPLLSDG